MPLPLIPIAIALLASGAVGAGAGAKGVSDMATAKKTANEARKKYDAALQRCEAHQRRTGKHLEAYGRRQIEVQATTLATWVDWLEQNERKVSRLQRKSVHGVNIAAIDLPELKKLVSEAKLLQGGVTAAVSAVAAQQAALAGVRGLAVAGTGTAISALSGAAAESATLAWLGGGTLAAGGGGVAAGGMVLTGVAVAPALMIGGITLAIQGEKARTKADGFAADAKQAIEDMQTHKALLKRLRVRADEVWSVLDRLVKRAEAAVKELASRDFDVERDLALFQRTAVLMAETGRVLETPLLGENGDVSTDSLTLIERYAA